MARQWRAEGHRVSVLTCFPNHPTGVVPQPYRRRRYLKEEVDGLEVHRVWTYATPNRGFIRKILSHLLFSVMAVLQGMPKLERPDVVVCSSPTLFSAFSAWLISRLFGSPFVMEVRDLWPAAIVELGVLKEGSPAVRALESLEMFLYRQAAKVVVVTHSFREVLVGRGVPPEKLTVITNGVDPERYRPGPRANDFRSQVGLGDAFVVLYAGAHGMSHALHVILGVAREMAVTAPDCRFVFVGDGAEKDRLVRQVEEWGLENVLFLPSQPAERMPAVYTSADVCLVPLRKVFLFSYFIPSKMFEILACARPIVASLDGEAAAILRDSGGAIVVPPEDGVGIAAAIEQLRADSKLADEMGRRGREYVLKHFDRRELAGRYLTLLMAAASQGGGRPS